MEDNPSLIESLFEKSEHYSKTSIELLRLKAIDKFADIVSSLISNIIVVIFVCLFFFIFNIGVSLWIGEMLGKVYYGFFIVSGFYAVVTIVIYLYRIQWIKTPLSNSIIDQALK